MPWLGFSSWVNTLCDVRITPSTEFMDVCSLKGKLVGYIVDLDISARNSDFCSPLDSSDFIHYCRENVNVVSEIIVNHQLNYLVC